MSEREFTQGDWVIERSDAHGICWINDAEGNNVCNMYVKAGPDTFLPCDNDLANAQRIIATNDMYEALEGSLTYLKQIMGFDGELEQVKDSIRAALSKARGESS